MKPTNTVAKLFSSVSTLAVVAGVISFNSVAWGQASVLAWGNNDYGQCLGTDTFGSAITSSADGKTPVQINGVSLTGVSAIEGGYQFTIALKSGSVLAWGRNDYGQCTIPAAAQSGVTAIAGGGWHAIALKDGGVLAWGRYDEGQCTIPAAALSGVYAIAVGDAFTIALKDGGVLAWGRNDEGQCTIPAAAQSGVTAIACGGLHTIALKDGKVLAWGRNTAGECSGTDSSGQPITSTPTGEPVKIMGQVLTGVSAIAGGGEHTIALKDGGVLAWGYTGRGNPCGIPDVAKSGVSAIAGGYYHTVALKGGSVLTWGYSSDGQCNNPAAAQSGVTAIGRVYYNTLALKGDPNDTDGDGIPNATDNCPSVANPTQADCDGNGVGDACETFTDCNANGIADVCEILSGTVTDQNLNGIPDTCEVSSVSRVLPISGPSTGGTAVRIIGTNFFSALPVSVTFGGAPATDVVVVSLTEITAVTPAGSPGDTVVTVNGASAEAFYYRPSCDGDLDNNGTIDSSDLGVMLTNYGNCYESAVAAPQEPMIFPIEAAKPVAVKK